MENDEESIINDIYKIIVKSEFFDAEWYIRHNPEIGMDPVRHYVLEGWRTGRNPSARFDNEEYYELNPDVKQANMNPLLHYEMFGKAEKRAIHKPVPTFSGIKDGLIEVQAIKKMMDNPDVKIISFDIFDTLLIRPVINPTDIFYLIDAKLRQDYNIEFINYRFNAEAELQNPYATLDDIYEYIKQKHGLSAKTVKIMKKEELDCEETLLSVRDDVYELYKYAVSLGKRIIVISDMYLPSKFLLKVLRKKGYTEIDKVYVSCECQSRKDSGALYKFVREKENNKNILHIGDNYVSDYVRAYENNMTAVYYPSIKNILFAPQTIYSSIWKIGVSADPMCRIVMGFTLNNYFKNMSKVANVQKVFADFKSFVLLGVAPLIFHIANQIAGNQEIQDNYSEILFASRDGFLPKIGYDIYRKYQKAKPSKYIYAGRRAYFSVKEDSFIEYVKQIKYMCRYDIYTIENLLNCYITDKNIVSKILSELTEKEKKLSFLKNKEQIISSLSRFSKLLDGYYMQHRENSYKYYRSIIKKSQRYIVFDCGYSGSISDNIGAITQKPIDKIYLWQSSTNLKKDIKNGTKTFLLLHEVMQFFGQDFICEEIFSPMEGGCLGFEKNTPLLEPINPDDAMKKCFKQLSEQTKEYMKNICSFFGEYLPYISIKDTKSLQAMMIYAFTNSPFDEISLLNDIKFPDPVFRTSVESLTDKVTLALAKP